MTIHAFSALRAEPAGSRAVLSASPFRAPDGAELLNRFRAVRARSLALAAPLSAEDQVVQSMPDASPTKWHLAHTTWFFETMILAETEGYRCFDPDYGYLFNSYYEALGPRQPRMHRGLLTRPSREAVLAYRRHVDAALERLLEGSELAPPLVARLVLGFAHEEQHQELILTDALHLLAQNPLQPAYDSSWCAPPSGVAEPAAWIELPGGLVEIGAAVRDGVGGPFAFDNEGPPHRVWLEPFAVSAGLATNRDWLRFIQGDGYARPELWLSDGWAAVQANDWRAPSYWNETDDGWRVFGPGGSRPLDLNAPVTHVSFYEADAFARWSNARLPTEAEWELLALTCPDAAPDLYGQAWQWTASPYTAYPGFEPSPGALGEYNGKFMVNQMALRGSSWATSPGHSRPSYRNFFPPDARWQVTGVRLAKDARATGRKHAQA